MRQSRSHQYLFRSTGSIVKFDGFTRLYQEAREEGEKRARKLIADAIQRVASEHVAEVTRAGILPDRFGELAIDRDRLAQAPPPGAAAQNGIPGNYLALYQAAGGQFGVPWTLLAGIGSIETDHGRSTAAGVTATATAVDTAAGTVQGTITALNPNPGNDMVIASMQARINERPATVTCPACTSACSSGARRGVGGATRGASAAAPARSARMRA